MHTENQEKLFPNKWKHYFIVNHSSQWKKIKSVGKKFPGIIGTINFLAFIKEAVSTLVRKKRECDFYFYT
jgi:hypothetical protein